MKRLLYVAVAAASAQMASSVSAEDNRMEHVLVTTPIQRREADTALPVTILTGEDLRRAAATTIGETLGSQAGIANATFGPGVGRPVIRGQQGPRAITLQNNVLSADVSGLSPDHSVTVEALLADSIEVLRGPSTLLYGGGAIGGVVNVIDNRIPRQAIDGIEGGIEYRYDEASDMDAGVGRIEGGNGTFSFHLSGTTRETDDLEIPGMAIDERAVEEQEELLGGHDEEEHDEEETENTDGFIANTDSETDVINAGFSFAFGEGSFAGFSVSHLESEYGLPPGAHAHHEHEEEHEEGEEEHDHEEEEEEIVRLDVEQTRYDAMLHLQNPTEWAEAVRAFLTYTDYEHDELEGSEVGTNFSRETWEGRLELVHNGFIGDHGVIGLQARADEFEAAGEEGYVPQTDSTDFGLFVLEDWHRGDWLYEVGARVDYAERDPDSVGASEEDFTAFSVSGSALWNIDGTWQLGFALSRSERAPLAEELFSNADARIDGVIDDELLVTHPATGAIEIGDPDLDEEVSLNLDVSLHWHVERSWAELSVFYNSFEDYIFLLNSGEEVDETPVYLYEQDDAEFFGVELDSSFHIVDIGAGALALGVRADVISGEFDDAGDVPRLPPYRVGGQLSWTGNNFHTYVSVLNAGDQDDPGDFETETDGWTRWDIGADYRFQIADASDVLLFLKWKNIGDDEIRLSTSFLRNFAPEAGESIEAGIRFTF